MEHPIHPMNVEEPIIVDELIDSSVIAAVVEIQQPSDRCESCLDTNSKYDSLYNKYRVLKMKYSAALQRVRRLSRRIADTSKLSLIVAFCTKYLTTSSSK